MELEKTHSNNKNIGIGIGVVALIVIGAIAVFGARKPDDSSVPAITPAAPDTATLKPTTTPTTNKPTSTTATYKDGTYTATGSYQSPGGLDHVTATLTLKNDIVTDSTVTTEGDNTSKHYQGIFLANYKPMVVGKNISSIQLTKVSGSSLTSGGFNDALKQIEAKAKA